MYLRKQEDEMRKMMAAEKAAAAARGEAIDETSEATSEDEDGEDKSEDAAAAEAAVAAAAAASSAGTESLAHQVAAAAAAAAAAPALMAMGLELGDLLQEEGDEGKVEAAAPAAYEEVRMRPKKEGGVGARKQVRRDLPNFHICWLFYLGKLQQHNRPLRDPELDRLSDWEGACADHRGDLSGNEADADDTSIDSRTSSRIMGESVDSLGHM